MELSGEDMAAINDYLQKNPQALLQIPNVRTLITASRIQRLKPEDIRTVDNVTPAPSRTWSNTTCRASPACGPSTVLPF